MVKAVNRVMRLGQAFTLCDFKTRNECFTGKKGLERNVQYNSLVVYDENYNFFFTTHYYYNTCLLLISSVVPCCCGVVVLYYWHQ